MLFFEYAFIFVFLPIFLVVDRLLPRRWRNLWILAASCGFYAASCLEFLPLLLASTALDYALGARIAGARTPASKRGWLAASVTLNLGALAFFKYAGLISRTLRGLPGCAWIPELVAPLPVGISFYTFQSLSYTIDLYRGAARPARSWIDFAAFVTFFPQLVAGPIVRFAQMSDALIQRHAGLDRLSEGLRLFVLGLGKKVIVADFAALAAAPLFALEQPGAAQAWVAMLLYAVQIYFDFSGYSDMAVGLGKLAGFDFPRNFDSPYKATSFSDFWRRWHITLSQWLRDNLYVPLGGNRGGAARTARNLLLTLALGGLWHGAGWNYLVWGLWHGGWLAAERSLAPRLGLTAPIWLRRGVVFVVVALGWVLFRFEDLGAAGRWYAALLGLAGDSAAAVPACAWASAVVGLALAWGFGNSLQPPRFRAVQCAGLACLFVLSVILAQGKGSSPFLYFRF